MSAKIEEPERPPRCLLLRSSAPAARNGAAMPVLVHRKRSPKRIAERDFSTLCACRPQVIGDGHSGI
jgi:hypothetical protein